jgi:PAN domain
MHFSNMARIFEGRGAKPTSGRERASDMRSTIALAASLIAVLAAAPVARGQVHYDRPGGDYSNFTLRAGDPAVCAMRCERDARCRAWSFAYPTPEGIAVCWLKSSVPNRVEADGSVSGVRGAGVIEPKSGPAEYSIDRIGGDYRTVELPPDPTGMACKAACEGESRCRAWTYLRPGYAGAAARCYIKDKVKPPCRRPCCISGVVR